MLKKIGAGFCFCIAASIYAYSLVGTQGEKGYFQTSSTAIGDSGVKGVIVGEDVEEDSAKNKGVRKKIEVTRNVADYSIPMTFKKLDDQKWSYQRDQKEIKYSANYSETTKNIVLSLVANNSIALHCKKIRNGYECLEPSHNQSKLNSFLLEEIEEVDSSSN